MAYKNPIPCLPEDDKFYEFSIKFSFQEPLTKTEAADSLSNFFKEYGVSAKHLKGIKMYYEREKG